MSVAAIFNVPKTPEERAQWAFAHAAHHRDIIRVIYQITGLALPEYAIDPVTDDGVWERQHQTMHQEMDAVLGIAGFDLLGVEWDDENKLAAWIQLNSQEHRQAGDILGLG